MRLTRGRWKLVSAAGIVLTATAAAACSFVLDTSADQCGNDGDCQVRGGAFQGSRCVGSICVAVPDSGAEGGADAGGEAGPLSCLGNNPTPKPTTVTVKLTVFLHDFLVSTQPVTDLKVRACPNPGDPFCAGVSATQTPDATGHVTFDLNVTAGPFAGYLAIDPVLPDGGSALVDGGNNGPVYMPTRVSYQSVPIAHDFNDDWGLPTYDTIQGMLSIYGLPSLDPNLGMGFLVAQDCTHADLAGISVSVDAVVSNTLAFYFSQGAPSSTATSTDSSGYAGFVNIPTGARVFSGAIAATQQKFGSITMYSLPGTLSMAPLGPDLTP